MGLKAAVQALKKAEELKAKVSRHSDLLNNSEAWSDQQQLQTVYHQVLVLDLEYALDKKVEQELWTLGFKNHIAALQHLSRDKKNPRRSECQALLSWCLEAASGFYLTLLQELCSTFELELPFRRRGAVYGQTRQPTSDQLIQPQKTSCLYICQYCLVHLGDIARYRSQRKQAESFYRHAILLSPSSGQPYNQLALLEASRGDRLATVFHYVRSISVKYPFPAAATNLANTFSALSDSHESIKDGHSKLSQNEFISIFLRVHSFLHSVTNLNQAEIYIKTLNATFTPLVATQMFSAAKLIQITAINIYALRRIADAISSNQLTNDEVRAKNLILELIAGSLNAFLLPIYTMNDNSLLLDYYALPAIKLTLDWIKTDPSVLNDAVFMKRLQLWPSLCKLLNNVQEKLEKFDGLKFTKTPLPEDRDLQCFLPLLKAFENLDFTTDNLTQNTSVYTSLRISRLVNLGIWLCSQHVNNNIFMTYKKTPNTNNIFFEPENKQPDPTTELLEELKYFNIKDNTPIVPKDNVQNIQINKNSIKGSEKRGGILKPQGSLEKSREEREQAFLLSSSENDNSSCNTSLSNSSLNSVRSETSKSKRTRQNVALQAIAKKVEENKQVTFQTEPIVKTIEKEITRPADPIYKVPNVQLPKQNEVPNLLPNINTTNERPNLPPIQYPMNYNQNQNFNCVNVGNIPFSGIPYPNNTTGMLYNTIQNNLQYTKPTNPINKPPPNFQYDRNIPMPPKDLFTPWVVDEKPPMPPSNWWGNQNKPPIQSFPQEMFKQNYPYNVNKPGSSNINYVQEPNQIGQNSMEYRQFSQNNFGLWNNAPNMQNNMPMMMNSGMMPPTQNNQMADVSRMNQTTASNKTQLQGPRESSDNQTNSMPGYSLFNSSWAPNVGPASIGPNSPTDMSMMRHQSLFSGPGPSPLERLLQQQRQMRGGSKDHS